jgi:hypothetical protein
MPLAKKLHISLPDALKDLAENNEEAKRAINNIPEQLFQLFYEPKKYTGDAKYKALEIANYARKTMRTF